jgi:hypothetical protein
MRKPKQQKLNDLSRSLIALDVDQTLIAVIELSQKSWLVAGIIPGVERQPLKKLEAGEDGLLKLLHRWRDEAEKAGHKIKRIAVAFEAGRDGFWLARWLRARGIEAHVIHAASVAVSREHRRAKTDRLDTEQLKRAFLGWLRGEREHCKMAAIPTFAEEDAKRPHREREGLVGEQTTIINRIKATLARLGIRNFNPKLKKAAERLEHVRTPEGEPIPQRQRLKKGARRITIAYNGDKRKTALPPRMAGQRCGSTGRIETSMQPINHPHCRTIHTTEGDQTFRYQYARALATRWRLRPCRPFLQYLGCYCVALCDVLVDALARELIIARDGLALDRFPCDARNRQRACLSDRLKVARPPSYLFRQLRLQVAHNLFDKLAVSVDVLPVTHAASDFFGKENFIAPS